MLQSMGSQRVRNDLATEQHNYVTFVSLSDSISPQLITWSETAAKNMVFNITLLEPSHSICLITYKMRIIAMPTSLDSYRDYCSISLCLFFIRMDLLKHIDR